MTTAIRGRAVVEPGNAITLRNDALPVGAEAEVIVLLETPPEKSATALAEEDHPLLQLLGTRQRHFSSAEEVEAWIREERDAWDG